MTRAPYGIPTLYKGREYRSRLEARWAAFFDLAGWRYEYEPFDLAGWIPDFVLKGSNEYLVEIKPVFALPEEIAEEMIAAAERHAWTGDLLIFGATFLGEPHQPEAERSKILGWLNTGPFDGKYLDGSDGYCPPDEWWQDVAIYGDASEIDISSCEGTWWPLIRGSRSKYDGKYGWNNGSVEAAHELWIEAGNLTQWRGRRSVTS
jgi:hypothetical protein